ncbi:GerAB/ArcD/ProY family transporter [Paenibacillus eucommiae]|uniref:Spore germination protein KB n=1 Tax=Paenibacillus eucommiae TaxID=1355755 RepID=A0ABS4IQX3_9BACL|nr:endospore germination permease [Paenibacillus eucommiae]MBP1989970.1 spore germination protein KB [Paenibacillus eucommiae]
MDKGKISSFQMAFLMFQSILGSSVLLMPSITTRISGQDMWMTPLICIVFGYFVFWLAVQLYRLSPDGTFIKLLETVFNKPIGKILNLLFLCFQIHILSIVTSDYGAFMVNNFFFKTPVVVILGAMLLLTCWVVKEGIEVLARCGQLFIPIITVSALLIFVMLLKELHPTEILPIFEKGITPLMKGSVIMSGWFCQLMVVIYILPHVKDEQAIMKWGIICVTGIAILMFVVNISVFMLLGDSTSFYNYPVFMAARYIRLANFFEHVESVVMMVWVLGEFIKISVHFYAVYIGLSQTFEFNHAARVFVFPLAFLILLMSFWSVNDFRTLAEFVSNSGTLYILTGFFLFPLFVYAIASIKRLIRT